MVRPLTSMVTITRAAENLSLLMDENAEVGIISGGGDCEDETIKRSLLTSKNSNEIMSYSTPGTKQAFTHFRQAFTKALIFWHFDLEYYIQIETNASSYAIGGVLSQLTSDNLGQWQLVVFYSQKIILAKTRYEIQNGELLAIVKAFKTWRHSLEICKHKVLVLINHNNLWHFMDTKSLSFGRVCWAQKLFSYHFCIDYHQGKANRAANTLCCFL